MKLPTAGPRSLELHPVGPDSGWIDTVMTRAGRATFILIGEASHGTEEFYRLRADLTRGLIESGGVTAVAVEADWPDARRVHAFVTGRGTDPSATAALGDFARFPRWMWRNEAVRDFAEWLRRWNDSVVPEARTGFHGLDLYSLHTSIAAVLDYLDANDPEAAVRARARYSCFERFGDDMQQYGYAATLGISSSCEAEVVAQLAELRLARASQWVAGEDTFSAEQNARLVTNAERYYRAMFGSAAESWNLRDIHMADTLDELAAYLDRRHGRNARIVVWAHNSHLGDARATDRHGAGELNLGQLVRERHPGECFLVGFSTWSGTVTAAHDWDLPPDRMTVREALRDSWESVFHAMDAGDFTCFPSESPAAFDRSRLQRAIGVIYRPATERQSHYFAARLARQFDAMVHVDVTTALRPLDTAPGEVPDIALDAPDTFPSAL